MWQRFASALLPLDSAGKLGVVLFQFPPWFLPGGESQGLHPRGEGAAPAPVHAWPWSSATTSGSPSATASARCASCADNRLPFVCVDEPQGFRSSVPPVVEATAADALVRFHGRNAENWERKGITAAERFAYLYPEEELQEWVDPIHRLAEKAERVHVLMNNCHQDWAVRNARQLALMMEERSG